MVKLLLFSAIIGFNLVANAIQKKTYDVNELQLTCDAIAHQMACPDEVKDTDLQGLCDAGWTQTSGSCQQFKGDLENACDAIAHQIACPDVKDDDLQKLCDAGWTKTSGSCQFQ